MNTMQARRPPVSEKKIRAILFRRDGKTGVSDILKYLRDRQNIRDPMFWPPRPLLSINGVKNVIERLRSDLDALEIFNGSDTMHLIKILNQTLEQLYLFRFESPPAQFRGTLGSNLVSIYVYLSQPTAFDDWNDTCANIEFHCLQCRNMIASRRLQVQFGRQAEIPCSRDGNCEAAVEVRNLFCFFWRPHSHARMHVYRKVPFD